MRSAAALLFLLFVPGVSAAEDFVIHNWDGERTELIELDGFQRSGPNVRFVRLSLWPDSTTGERLVERELYEMDCERGTVRVIGANIVPLEQPETHYTLHQPFPPELAGETQVIRPSTHSALLASHVCGHVAEIAPGAVRDTNWREAALAFNVLFLGRKERALSDTALEKWRRGYTTLATTERRPPQWAVLAAAGALLAGVALMAGLWSRRTPPTPLPDAA